MTTNFALSLSFDGIKLLHRVPQGWRLIDSANVEDPDLDASLSEMREKAAAIDPSVLRTKIVIPAEQIKYLEIPGTSASIDDIHAILDGATPYTLDELVIDYERSDGRTHIAAVARETLQEAEAFASGHGFNPICFVAVPEPFTFQNEVFFGPTVIMPELLGPDAIVERDPLPVLEASAPNSSHQVVDNSDSDGVTVGSGAAGTLIDHEGLTEQRAASGAIDPIIPEYHAPVVTAPLLMTAAAVEPKLSSAKIDTIIPEYQPAPAPVVLPPSLVAQATHPAPPRAVVGLTADKKPAPQATTRRPMFIAAAIAASIILVVGLVWAQRSQTTVDAPQVVTATLEADTVTAAQPAQPMQRVTSIAQPETTQLALETQRPTETQPDPPKPSGLETTTVADIPLSDVEDLVTPPEPETASATAGAPVLRGRVLTPDEAARIYAATGVWQRAPRFVGKPRTTTIEVINRPGPLPAPARIAQPGTAALVTDKTDLSFIAPAIPPPADMEFPIDENGQILATPEGTLTPEGAIVIAGLPDIDVRERPALSEDDLAQMAALSPAPEGVIIVPGAPAIQPPLRPDDLAPEDAIPPGGVALTSLETDRGATTDGSLIASSTTNAAVRPRLRPAGFVPPQRPADVPSNPDITSVIAGIADDAFIDITPRAVDASQRPETRPRNFARAVEIAKSREQPAPAPSSDNQPTVEVTLPQSNARVPGGVARAATEDGVIGLREMNLIGVYGRSSARRALVRLSNGRYMRVEVGSKLDGGEVTAIGDRALNYVKRGRTYVLELPTG